MKRKYFLMCLLAFFIIGGICAYGINKHVAEESDIRNSRTFIISGLYDSFCDVGAIYNDRGILHFFDVKSNLDVPLCSKINCEHLGESRNNPQPSCDAYVGVFAHCPAIVGDSLFYVNRTDAGGVFEKIFYRAETNGTKRKEIAKVSDVMNFNFGIYENGYLAYCYYNYEDIHGQTLEKQKAGICLLNLETESFERIYCEDQYWGIIEDAMICEDALFYEYTYMQEALDSDLDIEKVVSTEYQEYMKENRKKEVWRYDLKTKERECIWGGQADKLLLGYGFLYVQDTTKGYIYDLIRKEQNPLKIDDVCNKNITLFDEGIFIVGDGMVKTVDYYTGDLRKIGAYEDDEAFLLYGTTQHWIYGLCQKDGEYTVAYIKREQFMKGDFQWTLFTGK